MVHFQPAEMGAHPAVVVITLELQLVVLKLFIPVVVVIPLELLLVVDHV